MKKSKGMQLGTLFTVMLLLSMAFVSAVSAKENGNIILDLEDGKKIAYFHTMELSNTFPNLADWNGSSVEHEITYYNLNGDKAAYAFNIVKNNAYQGYLLVSATKDNYPILEFSKGELPHMSLEMKETSQDLVTKYATENCLSMEKSTPIYGGATFYYDEYKMMDEHGKLGKIIIMDLSTKKIIDITDVESSDLENEIDIFEREKIQEAWINLETGMAENGYLASTVSTRSIGYIYDVSLYRVPYEMCYLGCAPTAASMVLEYWEENGYSNLSYGDALIEDLADAMGTTNGSTSISMIDDGIEDVCDDCGYANFNAINDDNLFMSETMFEIDAARPFVLSMLDGGTGSGHTKPYNNHAVTCVGYSEGTSDYLFLHDTWDDENHHYITFGNWRDATATWVRP